MTNETLSQYVHSQRQRGVSDDDIKSALISAGWQEQLVLQALGSSGQVTHLATISEILRESWAVYKMLFWKLIGALLLPYIPFIITLILCFGTFTGLGISSNVSELSGSALAVAIFLVVLTIISGIAAALLCYGSTNYIVKHRFSNPKLKDAFKHATKIGIPLLGVIVLQIVILMPAAILLVIPAMILGVYLSTSNLFVIDEEVGPITAIKKSFALIKNYWWEMLARSMTVFLISLPILILSIIPVVGPLARVAFSPFEIIYIFLTYEHLKKFKATGLPKPKITKGAIAVLVSSFTIIVLFLGLIIAIISLSEDFKTTNGQQKIHRTNSSIYLEE